MSSLSTSSPYGMFHNSASHYGPTQSPPMRDGCTTSATFISALSTIKTNGGRTIWKVTGGPDGYSYLSNGESAYSHPMWKARMDEAAAKTSAAQMHNFVKDGTLIAVILNDDIEAGSIYPGGIPTGTEIEGEAAYLKSYWSMVPTCVRCRTGYLKTIAPSGSYTSLDFGWSQWKASRGNVSTWYTNEVNDGRACKLGVLAGFNLLDGGVGTAPWNQSPNQSGKFGMSPTEINAIAAALSSHTYMIGVIGWSHDGNGDGRARAYYESALINDALTNVANAAVGRLQGPLNWQSGNTSPSSQSVAGGWALRGVGTAIRNSDPTSQSVGMPTQFSAGNLLGIVGYSRDSARSFVAPGGWSLAKSISGSSARGGQLTLIYKIADGTEGNQTVTWAGTGGVGMSVACQSFAFSGNSSGGVLSTVGSSSTWAASSNMGPVKGGFTSAVSDALVLCIAAKGNDFNNGDPVPMDSMSATTSGGETWHRAFITTNGSGDDSGMFLDWTALSGTPSITTKSWTALTSSSGSGAGFLVSFRPAAVVSGQPPSIAAIQDVTISVLSTLSFTASSTGSTPITWDLNDDAPSTITLGATTGAFQWTPTTPGEGVYPLVLSATNAFGLDTEAFVITVVSSGTTGSIVSSTTTASGSTVTILSGSSGTSFLQNVAPVVLNPGDQVARTGERVSLFIDCADADNDPLVCSLEPSTAPLGSLFDPMVNQFLWTPQTAGTYQFTVIASDGQHESRSTFTITVNDSRWHRTGRLPTTDFGRTNDSGNAFKRI